MNCRIPNGTYGGVRGQGFAALSYSIVWIVLSSFLGQLPDNIEGWFKDKFNPPITKL
jgi:hypothetical protein